MRSAAREIFAHLRLPSRGLENLSCSLMLALIFASCSGCDATSSAHNSPANKSSTENGPASKPVEVPATVSDPSNKHQATSPSGGGAAKGITFDDIKLELKKGEPYDPSLLTAK